MSLNCSICAENIFSDGSVTQCGHSFHFKCLETWVMRSPSCPKCRKIVTLDSIIKLFDLGDDEQELEGQDSTKTRLDLPISLNIKKTSPSSTTDPDTVEGNHIKAHHTALLLFLDGVNFYVTSAMENIQAQMIDRLDVHIGSTDILTTQFLGFLTVYDSILTTRNKLSLLQGLQQKFPDAHFYYPQHRNTSKMVELNNKHHIIRNSKFHVANKPIYRPSESCVENLVVGNTNFRIIWLDLSYFGCVIKGPWTTLCYLVTKIHKLEHSKKLLKRLACQYNIDHLIIMPFDHSINPMVQTILLARNLLGSPKTVAVCKHENKIEELERTLHRKSFTENVVVIDNVQNNPTVLY